MSETESEVACDWATDEEIRAWVLEMRTLGFTAIGIGEHDEQLSDETMERFAEDLQPLTAALMRYVGGSAEFLGEDAYYGRIQHAMSRGGLPLPEINVFITQGVRHAMAREIELLDALVPDMNAFELAECVAGELRLLHEQHNEGGWNREDLHFMGVGSEHDRRVNDTGVSDGARIITWPQFIGRKLMIVTEWDRSVTTLMLAEEY